MTFRDIIIQALQEIQAIAQGEVPSAQEMSDGLVRLNRLMDRWAARKILAFNVGFQLFTLQPNLSPHTIGPNGTFVVPQRPVRIESAALVLNLTNPSTDIPIAIRDDQWWAQNRVKAQTSNTPTDLYYSADWPNGSCYFWPVPTVNYQVRLELWGLLGQFSSLQGTFSLPPGYWDAVVLQLALNLAPAWAGIVTPELRENARAALAAIEGNNGKSPRTTTSDAGMPDKARKSRGGFNWATGLPS